MTAEYHFSIWAEAPDFKGPVDMTGSNEDIIAYVRSVFLTPIMFEDFDDEILFYPAGSDLDDEDLEPIAGATIEGPAT